MACKLAKITNRMIMNKESLGKKFNGRNIIIATILLTALGTAVVLACEPAWGPWQPNTAPTITVTCPTPCDQVYSGGSLSVSASCNVVESDGTEIMTDSNNCCPAKTQPDPLGAATTTWIASGCGASPTNGTGTTATVNINTNGSVTVTFTSGATDDFTNGYTNSASATINAVMLTSICEATTPTNQSRTTIGVGEAVDLNLVTPSGSVTWSNSGGGTLSTTSGSSTTFTAPDRGQTCTITATETSNTNCSPTWSKTFSVIEPSGAYYVTNLLYHTYDEANIGFQALIYLQPDSVNFGAVQCQEEQAYLVANGVYSQYNGVGHQPYQVATFGTTVVPGRGTGDATGSGFPSDTCYSGDTDSSLHLPYANGSETLAIPWDFKVGSGAWKTNFISLTWHCSKSDGGWDNEGILQASKANASFSCEVDLSGLGTP